MSSRTLSRMKPSEIKQIIDARTGEIQDAEQILASLEERRAFAERISAELKYKSLERAIERETITVPVDVVLLKTLAEMQIRPFDRRTVERYKDRMAGNRLNVLLKALGFPIFFCGLVATVVLIIVSFNAPEIALKELGISTVWSALLGIGAFMLWLEHTFVHRREWEKTSFEYYSSPKGLLPREALELALRIKGRLSKANFTVHSLKIDRGPWLKVGDAIGTAFFDPDPFLEVDLAGEAYYIAVWDEPGFDGKLLTVD